MTKIVYLGQSQLSHPFEREPSVHIKTRFGWHTETVDPFPCYSHDRDVLEDTIKRVEESFRLPPPFSPSWYVLEFDGKPQVNGSASRQFDYWSKRAQKLKKERETIGSLSANLPEWHGYLILYGKRTPIHPAMTEYVVAHEYGHIVDYYIERMAGHEPDRQLGDKDYAKLRNMKNDQSYGGKKWHKNIGEVIANDFRILIAGIQPEYWPHDYSRPIEGTELHKWWLKKKELYSI